MALGLTKIENLQDAVVTVMGLGRFKQGSGVGAAKWLMRHGAQIVVTDVKGEKELKSSVDLIMEWYASSRKEFPEREIYSPVFVLGKHDPDDFVNVDLVVKNPDVPKDHAYVKLAHDAGIMVESDVSLFLRFYPHPVYAVTGTRGKSTTTALLGEMLKHLHPKTVVAGNIMHSPLEDLDWMLEEPGPVPVALELSSWLLEGIDHVGRCPEIAVLTNVSVDHLDRYENFDVYFEAKMLLFKRQTPEQKAVLNYDHELVRKAGDRVRSKKYWFSKTKLPEGMEGTYIEGDGDLVLRLGGPDRVICNTKNWPSLQGEHNVENALAATLASALAGVPDEGLCGALRTFQGLEGRQQTVREVNGVTYVNDTTATSPEGVIAALKRFRNGQRKNLVIILGGKAKGFSFDEMAKLVRETCKHVVYIEGSSTEEIEKAVGPEVPSTFVSDMESAVEACQKAAAAGDVVLLSPGTASFGLFKNAYDRGGQFVEAVKNLK
ncbi:UDP-N-acetylmuramoylalanine--D-glutamate ligase [Candidatus Uhrbacteria bacterium RIFCSPHIGHO2_01_FULL_63_20]|uniref:UDP-N-acetylmuramoylalanine--D-glutamate ligase n=1 Tax=Candidatus Uhrbacteria bacterium RIFCSPHIGHO2_01_FULL_63_20 TaxID=1802385 RepID=A0A1F7TKR2_9BACT|nr:MAG: UDP-N-acetylmuramoylalanine--D-glutamate ligase [Candidatus Uhrbacteria bacterium RIFCSPHIGHO2_01_FULL_63_20]